jgi:AbrB family looped-hinge helix DNA binding protein
MKLAQSKVTVQGQISVPAEVRRRLGVGPGSLLEWSEENGQVTVRKAGRTTTSAELHRALFGDHPPRSPGKPVDVKEAIREYVRKKHARG